MAINSMNLSVGLQDKVKEVILIVLHLKRMYLTMELYMIGSKLLIYLNLKLREI